MAKPFATRRVRTAYLNRHFPNAENVPPGPFRAAPSGGKETKMLRKYLFAGMALAFVAAPALSISAQAGPNDSARYFVVKAPDGSCTVGLSQRGDVLGHFTSRSAADRALNVLKSGAEC